MQADSRRGAVLTAVLMLAIFVTMTLMALGFPQKARVMPLMAGVPGSILALIAVIQELRKGAASAAAAPESRRAERWMLLWMLAYCLGILAFGFLYAAPLLVWAFLVLGKRESLVTGAIGAVVTWGVLYGLFEQAFQIPLFDGLVAGWLIG
jgi:hypothetical protein